LEMKKNGDLCYFFNFNDSKDFLRAVEKSKKKDAYKINRAYSYSKKFMMLPHYKNLKKILI